MRKSGKWKKKDGEKEKHSDPSLSHALNILDLDIN